MAFAVSIEEPPPIGTTTVPSSPKSRSAAAPARRSRRPGFGSTLVEERRLDARGGEDAHDRVDDARSHDARVGDDEDARATGRATSSGSASIAPTPKQDPIAQDDLDRAIGEVAVTQDLRGRCRSTCRGGPSASAGSRRRGTSARSSTPSGLSKTQTSSKSRSSGSVIESGAVRRSPPNVNSSSGRRPQRGQSSPSISASPPSPGRPGRGRAGTGRARTARSAPAAGPWRSARPSPSPPAGMALKPHVPQPVVTRKPSTPVCAHDRAESRPRCRRCRPTCAGCAGREERQQARDLVGVARSAANDDWREYDGWRRTRRR